MSTATSLRGKTVYGQGSYAPTRGTNDPSGYIQRGLRNNASPSGTVNPGTANNQGIYGGVSATGGDGESDTRSGIAQATLNGQQVENTASGISTQPTPVGISEPLIITETGQMQLPFDYNFAQGALQKKQETDQGLLGLQQKRQSDAIEFIRNKYNAQRQYGKQKLGTLNNFAGRGVAFSSGYGKSVANNATDFNNLSQQLQEAETRSINDSNTGRTMLQTQFQDYLRNQAVARGVSLETLMGSLGYGK